jgi:hypothetical protein
MPINASRAHSWRGRSLRRAVDVLHTAHMVEEVRLVAPTQRGRACAFLLEFPPRPSQSLGRASKFPDKAQALEKIRDLTPAAGRGNPASRRASICHGEPAPRRVARDRDATGGHALVEKPAVGCHRVVHRRGERGAPGAQRYSSRGALDPAAVAIAAARWRWERSEPIT